MAMVGALIGPGIFIAVVGPSGAGKDTIIAAAARRFAAESHVEFVRRVITRSCDGASELHDTLSPAEFEEAEAAGRFAVAWRAHGLHYGIPASVDAAVAEGRVVVANASRGAVAALRRRYRRVVAVEITARPEILARRLAARGRESEADVLARLARAAPDKGALGAVTIDNSGPAAIAGERFCEIVAEALAEARKAAGL